MGHEFIASVRLKNRQTLYTFGTFVIAINWGFSSQIMLETRNVYIITLYVTLDHKTSLKSLGYICSNSQKYKVWVKIIDFSLMPKIIRTLSKDQVP